MKSPSLLLWLSTNLQADLKHMKLPHIAVFVYFYTKCYIEGEMIDSNSR